MTHPRGTRRNARGHRSPSGHEPWPDNPLRALSLAAASGALRAAAGLAGLADRLTDTTGLLPDLGHDAADRLARWHDRVDWPERPIRVGLLNPTTWADRLAFEPGAMDVEWLVVPDGHATDPCLDHALDVCLRFQPEHALTAYVCERQGLDAAWYDWAGERPLSYPAVFPARLDCARISLPRADTPHDPAMVRLLLEAAGVLSRHPARLTLDDRLVGRRPIQLSPAAPSAPGAFVPAPDPVRLVMDEIRGVLDGLPVTPETPAAPRVASRVLSAWAAAWPGEIDEASRRRAAESAARFTADEAETMLRLAAVRLGCTDDPAGLDALERADRMVRSRPALHACDHAAFLAAELSAGQPGPWTIGRLAVAVCLAVAELPIDKLPFFRDDLLDDLAHSPILVGRDQDQHLIHQVFRAMERSRRADERGLPGRRVA
jgi:hypothetical protein